MKTVILDFDNKKQMTKPLSIGLGFFESLHLGHGKVMDRVFLMAEKLDADTAIITFAKENEFDKSVLFTYQERLRIYERYTNRSSKIGFVIVIPFTDEIKKMPAAEFIDKLTTNFNVKALIYGSSYRFGFKAEGTPGLLEKWSKAKGYLAKRVDCCYFNSTVASSSYAKTLLKNGNLIGVNAILGRFFSIEGEVVKGQERGKTLGFPTANLKVAKEKMIPVPGVYKTITTVDKAKYPSITHIGGKPTFHDLDDSIETHIVDYSGDLYGKIITISFIKKIRDIQTFDSVKELIEQIKKDLLIARQL